MFDCFHFFPSTAWNQQIINLIHTKCKRILCASGGLILTASPNLNLTAQDVLVYWHSCMCDYSPVDLVIQVPVPVKDSTLVLSTLASTIITRYRTCISRIPRGKFTWFGLVLTIRLWRMHQTTSWIAKLTPECLWRIKVCFKCAFGMML